MKSRIMPPTYFFILLFLSIALHFLFPIKKVIFPPYTYLGFVLIVFGAVVNIWSDLLLKKKKTTVKPYGKPTTLITSGPFRISRNPQYLGFAAIIIGRSNQSWNFNHFYLSSALHTFNGNNVYSF